jgi:hypothetical protein
MIVHDSSGLWPVVVATTLFFTVTMAPPNLCDLYDVYSRANYDARAWPMHSTA